MSRGPVARSNAIGEQLPESLVTLMRIDIRAQNHALAEGHPDPFPSPRTRGRARGRAKAVAGPLGGVVPTLQIRGRIATRRRGNPMVPLPPTVVPLSAVMSMSKQIHDESQRRKQVKFRAPESIVEEFDQWCDEQDMSRAEALRTQMRAVASAGEEYETPRQPPTDDDRLATAYRRLCAVANQDGIIREDTATSILATALGISKKETKPMVLRRSTNADI